MPGYLFAEGDLGPTLDESKRRLRDEIQRLERDYALRVSETDLCSHFIDKYKVEAPTLRRDEIHVLDPAETDIDVSRDWSRAHYGGPASVRGTRITFVVLF